MVLELRKVHEPKIVEKLIMPECSHKLTMPPRIIAIIAEQIVLGKQEINSGEKCFFSTALLFAYSISSPYFLNTSGPESAAVTLVTPICLVYTALPYQPSYTL